VSEVPLVLRLLADTSGAEAEIKALDAQVEETVSKWKVARQEVINQLSALNQSILYTFQAVRLAAKATGQAITPIQSALMGVISGTTSLMLSTATLMASTGILAGVAVVLAAFALGFQITETAKITVELISAQEKISSVEQAVARLQAHAMTPRF
jgi:hypothetical protein